MPGVRPLNPQIVKQHLTADTPVWLSLSGGLDSMVLLSLLVDAGVSFKAIHVNHQLSAHANAWADHCQAWCDQWGVPLVVEKVAVDPAGQGLEAAARHARYRAIARHLAPGAQLLTAHHLDDQAETLLLRLMRGAGPSGLAAIRSRQWFEQAPGFWLVRPLLMESRVGLQHYAEARSLRWVEDESNQDTRLDRNFIRARVLPMLGGRWPKAAARLAQTARLCEANQRLLDQVALEDGLRLARPAEAMGWSLPLAGLRSLSDERRANLLRFWMGHWPLVPEQVQLEELWRQVSSAVEDARVRIQWGEAEWRRFDDRLWLLPRQLKAPEIVQPLTPGQWAAFGNGRVRLVAQTGGLALPEGGAFELKGRQGGERAHPEGRQHSQTLKKLLQAQALAPWLRDQLPLLYGDGRLVAVGDLWLEQGAPRADAGWRLEWQLPQNQPPF